MISVHNQTRLSGGETPQTVVSAQSQPVKHLISSSTARNDDKKILSTLYSGQTEQSEAFKPIQVKQGHNYFASGNKAVSGVKDLLKMSNDPNRGPVIKRDLLQSADQNKLGNQQRVNERANQYKNQREDSFIGKTDSVVTSLLSRDDIIASKSEVK